MKGRLFLLVVLFIYDCGAPPVNEKKKGKDKEHAETNDIDQQVFDVEYKRYLQEVVNVLESDPDFKDRLLKADPDDIKSGKIAGELEFVNHNVRTKLDELKRQELERLRHLAIQQYEQSNGIDKKHMKIPAHIDPKNPHTFESEDLRKLIVQTTKELEETDRQRKEEFKEYEMQKELLYEEQLKHLDQKQRKEAEEAHKTLLEKHKEHKPLHHPGSKQQLEQVWEEQDRMSPEDFNPKTFFHMHDLDGNGVWDANEVKALFKKELDKMYDPNAPEDDIRERYEEMERMREHVFNETDTNKDQLVSYKEFLEQTKKQDFERDEGWDPVDQQPAYTQEEYKEYARQHEEEMRRMVEQGMGVPGMPSNGIPPQYLHHGQGQGYPPPAMHGQPYHHGAPQQHHEQQMQYQHPPPVQHNQQHQFDPHQQQQFHPNAIPQHDQPPYHPPSHPNQQHYQQQAPVQHYPHDQQQQQHIQQQHHIQQQQLHAQQQQHPIEHQQQLHVQQQQHPIEHQQGPVPPVNTYPGGHPPAAADTQIHVNQGQPQISSHAANIETNSVNSNPHSDSAHLANPSSPQGVPVSNQAQQASH